MPASEADRRHFALIAATMADEKAEQRREALQTSMAERVALGFRLGAGPHSAACEAALDARAAAQIGLAQRRGRRA